MAPVTRSPAPKWPVALVTGASSGIGAAFARHLAAAGSDLVVVARRRNRLEALAEELGSAGGDGPGTGRRVETLVADLTDPEQLAVVEARLRDPARPVDLLVNNAGIGGHGPFAELPIDEEERRIRLNLLAPARLTSAVLPGMIERGRGGIVNVSSVSGEQPVPYVATYSATKAYLTTFSEALHEEVRRQGVTVVAVLPGFTRTEFHEAADMSRRLPGPMWMSSDAIAEGALKALAEGRAVCVPGTGYRVLVGLARHAPAGACPPRRWPRGSAGLTFAVRTATAADVDAWVALYVAVAEEGRWIAGETPATARGSWRHDLRDRVAERIERTDMHAHLVAEAGGTVIGQAHLDFAPYGVASLGMAVAPDWRRRGVGTALLNAAVAVARERGAHKVALQAWPHNAAAIALYRRAGFVEEGVLRRHYRRRNGELWGAVVMGLLLDEVPPTSPGTEG